MKHYILAALMALGLTTMGRANQQEWNQSDPAVYAEYGDDDPNISASFQARLQPYGEWIDGNYGRAWRPYSVDRNWRPYLNGRWEWTD